MEQRNELLCGIPALILGAPSERVFFYVHGKMGSKEEALDFAAVADAHGWQVVSIDLPEHGARKDLPEPFTPANGFSCSRQTRPWRSATFCMISILIWF